ncbi:UNVERIFIED_ORG: hypothetical protein J3D58_002528 [Paenarthrobacter nicotinovorans]
MKTKNQTDTTTPTGNNGRTRLHKIRNQLKTRPPHTGVRNDPAIISTNQKTIGINKLGTLLSSQTTDTNRHHPHPTGSRIAPEQLSKLTRTTRSWQINVSAIFHPVLGPTRWLHAQKHAISRLLSRGLASAVPSSRLSHSRRLRRHYTPPRPDTNPPPTPAKTPQTQRKPPLNNIQKPHNHQKPSP